MLVVGLVEVQDLEGPKCRRILGVRMCWVQDRWLWEHRRRLSQDNHRVGVRRRNVTCTHTITRTSALATQCSRALTEVSIPIISL